MLFGAIIGDIVGSIYEFDNIKTKDFPFFSDNSSITDDSCMTIAVAKALMDWKRDGGDLQQITIKSMRELEAAIRRTNGGNLTCRQAWLLRRIQRKFLYKLLNVFFQESFLMNSLGSFIDITKTWAVFIVVVYNATCLQV